MAITKKYSTDKSECKVTFKISKDIGHKYKIAQIVGDFNDWNTQATPMNKSKKDGSFTISLKLPKNNEYQFRYLLDNEKWINDDDADKQVPTYFMDSENSVVMT